MNIINIDYSDADYKKKYLKYKSKYLNLKLNKQTGGSDKKSTLTVFKSATCPACINYMNDLSKDVEDIADKYNVKYKVWELTENKNEPPIQFEYVPTLALKVNGKHIKFEGSRSKEAIENFIKEHT